MSILSFDKSFEKQPSEQLTIRAEFAQLYSSLTISGYALSSVDLKIFDSTGADKTTDMLLGTPTIDETNYYIFATLQDGTDGMDYYARFKTTWTKAGQPDQKPESDLLIQVRQKGF